jgi:hypothetical protein
MKPMWVCEARPMFTLRPVGCWPVIDVSGCGRFSPFPSDAAGVFQQASATVLRLLSVFPAGLLPFWAGVPAIGVGHPAIAAMPGSRSIPCPGPPFGPS